MLVPVWLPKVISMLSRPSWMWLLRGFAPFSGIGQKPAPLATQLEQSTPETANFSAGRNESLTFHLQPLGRWKEVYNKEKSKSPSMFIVSTLHDTRSFFSQTDTFMGL